MGVLSLILICLYPVSLHSRLSYRPYRHLFTTSLNQKETKRRRRINTKHYQFPIYPQQQIKTISIRYIPCVPLATEPGISLIILTPMKILQWNLNRSTFIVWEMKRTASVVCVCSAPNCCDMEQRSVRCNILISGRVIKEIPGSVGSGTHGTCYLKYCDNILYSFIYIIDTVIHLKKRNYDMVF